MHAKQNLPPHMKVISPVSPILLIPPSFPVLTCLVDFSSVEHVPIAFLDPTMHGARCLTPSRLTLLPPYEFEGPLPLCGLAIHARRFRTTRLGRGGGWSIGTRWTRAKGGPCGLCARARGELMVDGCQRVVHRFTGELPGPVEVFSSTQINLSCS